MVSFAVDEMTLIQRPGRMNGQAEREFAEEERREPNDWHAEENRRVADENRTNMSELPMNEVHPNEEMNRNTPADILARREPGTTEALFNPKEMGADILTNCVRATELSGRSPGENGIEGIGKLMKKSLDALNVSNKMNYKNI